MTMFEFMQNAFFLLCGIICIDRRDLPHLREARHEEKYRIQLQRRYAKEKRE